MWLIRYILYPIELTTQLFENRFTKMLVADYVTCKVIDKQLPFILIQSLVWCNDILDRLVYDMIMKLCDEVKTYGI